MAFYIGAEDDLRRRLEDALWERFTARVRNLAGLVGALLVVAGLGGWAGLRSDVSTTVERELRGSAIGVLHEQAKSRLQAVESLHTEVNALAIKSRAHWRAMEGANIDSMAARVGAILKANAEFLASASRVQPGDAGDTLSLQGRSGKAALVFASSGAAGGYSWFNNEAGVRVGYLGASTNGLGILELADENGRARVQHRVEAHGGAF